MQSALHQNAGATERQGLINFLINGLERLDVSFSGSHGPVERAEGTILGAEVRVVDIPIDLVGDYTRGMQPLANGIGFHGDCQEVVGSEKIKRLLTA